MPSPPVVVCPTCIQRMRPKENGIRALETVHGEPYVLWACDEWACPVCGTTVLVGFGMRGIEKHAESFKDSVARARSAGKLREFGG